MKNEKREAENLLTIALIQVKPITHQRPQMLFPEKIRLIYYLIFDNSILAVTKKRPLKKLLP